ncbi:molybdopterin-dependent oxidoreductase [Gemmata sp. G18]|uniref:Molybdopterin-dependent oxidoreductase n=1 Tax=Gemmata palustris TaxID=2822762 RepID=A0ABS5BMT8_9BACT|nr:molybdopterin-dependent oxidoreductase [Gemmata palustris]
MPGLGASFGRGAATNFQQDMANSDCILFMGTNTAEAHPVAFRWPMKAKENGATLIHVDPRFTRTSALCDVFVDIRAGSDIAFLGGLVNHVLTQDKWFKEYVLAYTNASSIIQDGFRDSEDLDGLFSGYHGDGATGKYDAQEGHWGFTGCGNQESGAGANGTMLKEEPGIQGHDLQGGAQAHSAPREDVAGADEPLRDPTLQHPSCVFQILKRHFARYTPEVVSRVCGCTPEQLTRVAELLCANSGRERTTCIAYALGWTQHTTGVQMIRTAGILQLLLGNMGRPGGGIMAMRGHSTIQGSTDLATLYDALPGYLPQPAADKEHETLDEYVKHEGMTTGVWADFRKYIVSLLKAWYGSAATPENDFGFGWLPRVDADYSQLAYFDRMAKGEIKGYFLFGQNPGGGGPNAGLHRAGLRNLDWLVVADWFEIESAVFWRSDPTGPPPADIKTEVFFLPAAAAPEKEGSLTNTQRMLQWHHKAMDPQGDSRSDAWFLYKLGKRLKELYAGSIDPKDQALLNLTWDYDYDEEPRLPDGTRSRIEGEPDLEKVLQEINGHRLNETDPSTREPKLVSSFSELKADGTTACGCWLYSGVCPAPDRNRSKERVRTDNPLHPEWGFAWPDNRRVLYNRASADPDGKPWSERKKLVWWDESQRRWVGLDRPDFEVGKPPGYRPPPDATGMAAIGGDRPFITKPDGLGWLYAPAVKDGPLPTHYEPVESPVGNLLYPKQTCSPTVRMFDGPLNRLSRTPTGEFPVVATTFRLTEHYLSGPMSRFNSWLNELQPEMFVELSPELAAERGIVHADWLTVVSGRGRIEARAMVTRRLRPLLIEGRIVHQIGLPFHWAFAGEVVGGNANDLTSLVADPNVSMHESKAFACQVLAGRLEGTAAGPTVKAVRWPIRGGIPVTPTSAQPEGEPEHG